MSFGPITNFEDFVSWSQSAHEDKRLELQRVYDFLNATKINIYALMSGTPMLYVDHVRGQERIAELEEALRPFAKCHAAGGNPLEHARKRTSLYHWHRAYRLLATEDGKARREAEPACAHESIVLKMVPDERPHLYCPECRYSATLEPEFAQAARAFKREVEGDLTVCRARILELEAQRESTIETHQAESGEYESTCVTCGEETDEPHSHLECFEAGKRVAVEDRGIYSWVAGDALGPDPSGRKFSALLFETADYLYTIGCGPLSDCIRHKASDVDTAESMLANPSDVKTKTEVDLEAAHKCVLELKAVVSNVYDALFPRDGYFDPDAEHHIHMHSADLPDYHRDACKVILAVRDAMPQHVESVQPEVVPMLLFCPICRTQHVDAPEPESGWTNPPHRSHKCKTCKHTWRPADVFTTGVAELTTKGKADGSAVPSFKFAYKPMEMLVEAMRTIGTDLGKAMEDYALELEEAIEKQQESDRDVAHSVRQELNEVRRQAAEHAQDTEILRQLAGEIIYGLRGIDPAKRQRLEELKSTTLWCVHLRGPDTLIAQPDWNTACHRAETWNEQVRNMDERERAAGETGTMPSDVLEYVVEVWPHSPEGHAESLAKDGGDPKDHC